MKKTGKNLTFYFRHLLQQHFVHLYLFWSKFCALCQIWESATFQIKVILQSFFELFHVSELTRKPQNWVTCRGLVVERWYRKWRVPGSNPTLAKITQTGFFHHLSPSLNNTTLLKMEHRFSQQRKQKMLESSSRVFK